MESEILIQQHTKDTFKESNKLLCWICLTTSKDDNITESTHYVDTYNQLLKKNTLVEDALSNNKIFLCMWCKSVLKKFLTLRTLALASEKILTNQQYIPVNVNQGRPHIPSISTISHTDILIDFQEYKNQIKGKDSLHNICNTIEANTDIGSDNDNSIVETKLDKDYNELDSCEIEFDDDNISGPQLPMTQSASEENEIHNQKCIDKDENVQLKNCVEKIRKKQKVILKRTNIELKLEELQFEVRYLDLEQQQREMETKRIKNKNMRFQCDICGKGFMTNDYIPEHNVRHTESAGSYKCSLCKLHFKTQRVFSQHVLLHRRQFVCLLCGVTFSKWSNCSVHRYKCGVSVMYCRCDVCSKPFSDEYSLKIHMKLHKLDEKYSCDHCKKKFKTKQRLIVHKRIHSGEKPFACEHCPRSFSTHSNLKVHQEVHSKGSCHYCVECDTYYSTARGLKRHLNESSRHTRERNESFSCKECPKKFCTNSQLQHHLTRHSKEKHVLCEYCNKTISNKSNLRKHMRLQHPEGNT